MENHSLSDIIGNTSQAPYLNSLATECGLATNYHNISHPSLPNYLAATSGLSMSQLPVLSDTDCSVSPVCDTSAPSIFGQGETWQAYQESMPSSCDKSNSGECAIRHNPPPYFTSLSGCASDDVPYTQLATDLATIADGDSWLASNLAHDPEQRRLPGRPHRRVHYLGRGVGRVHRGEQRDQHLGHQLPGPQRLRILDQ